MLAALRRAGVRVTTVVLRDRRDAARLGDVRARLVLVDTIAASLAAPHLARLRARGSEVVTLALMSQGAMALVRRSDRLISCSRALADELVAGGIDRRRIVVVSPGRDRVRPRKNAKRRGPILCVANFSRSPQPVELNLLRYAGKVPVEMLGSEPYPRIEAAPYPLTLDPRGFHWFLLTDAS